MTFVIRNRQWFYLFVAIFLEVIGTVAIRLSTFESSLVSPEMALMAMYALIGLSYFFLARSILRMPIGVAYACWEGFGLVIITLVGVLAFGEEMTWVRLGGLVAIVVGAALIHHGTAMKKVSKSPATPAKGALPPLASRRAA